MGKNARRKVKLMGGIILCFSLLGEAHPLFIKVRGIEETLIRKVCVNPLDDNIIYVRGLNSLFKSTNGGRQWKKIFVSESGQIQDIYADKYVYDVFYLVTDYALYWFSSNRKKKIFNFPPEVKGSCIKKCGKIFYLGTTEGVYYAEENIWKWKVLKGLPHRSVYSIDCSGNEIFIATEDGIYVAHNREGFKRSLVFKHTAINEEEIEEESNEGDVSNGIIIHDIFYPGRIYAGTQRGLFVSYDRGRSWVKISLSGIDKLNIKDIAQSHLEKNKIYLATDRGIYLADITSNDSLPLFEGLPTRNIFSVDFNRKGVLFVATSKGLFYQDRFTKATSWREFDELCKNEPSIREVQEAALIYNEVDPSKIRKWRRALKYRAFFPSISLDYDKTVYGSSSGNFAIGPKDWGVSFSWDIANLIWNSYEDEVDTRSRLVTQLRISILDDINTTYFERLKVKQRLRSKEYKDRSERFKDEIRLRELTASLDAYTGGYFSKKVREIQKKENSE